MSAIALTLKIACSDLNSVPPSKRYSKVLTAPSTWLTTWPDSEIRPFIGDVRGEGHPGEGRAPGLSDRSPGETAT